MPVNLHSEVRGCRTMSSTQTGYMLRPFKKQKHPPPVFIFLAKLGVCACWCKSWASWSGILLAQYSTGSKKGRTENQRHLVDIVLSGRIYRMMVLEKSGVCPAVLSSVHMMETEGRGKMEGESLHV